MIFSRLIANGAVEFEAVENGYEGPLYAEISPHLLCSGSLGSCLSQLRLRRGPAMISDNTMQELQETSGLVHGSETPNIRDGVGLSVNLPDEKSGMIGWRAQTCRSNRHRRPAQLFCQCVLGTVD